MIEAASALPLPLAIAGLVTCAAALVAWVGWWVGSRFEIRIRVVEDCRACGQAVERCLCAGPR